MLRTSSYTIYFDLPETPSEVLLAHGYSGAFDRVSSEVAAWVRSLDTSRPPKPRHASALSAPAPGTTAQTPSRQTLETLKRRGYLTEKSPEQEARFFTDLVSKIHRRALLGDPCYLFMPTYDCNLRCSYCFQSHLRTAPAAPRRLWRTMQPAMVDRIFRGLQSLESSQPPGTGGPRRRRIGLFGGEPLLASSRRAVERICAKALEMGDTELWAVTNATQLAAYRDLLGPSGISSLQITFDGPSFEHDRRRIHPDGSGSYERIAANVDLALSLGARVSARVNVDRGNLRHLPALAADVVARGWAAHRGFSLRAAPIEPADGQTDRRMIFNTWQLEGALDKLRERHESMTVVGKPDDLIEARVRRILAAGADPFATFRESFCGAHATTTIFDALGDVYVCWMRTGDPGLRIGHVTADGEVALDHDRHRAWRGRTVASNAACARCRYALYCGGGCAARALEATGELNTRFCDQFQKRFRARVVHAYQASCRGAHRSGLTRPNAAHPTTTDIASRRQP